QAVKNLKLSTNCYAVDTWKGDEHAGFYSEEIYLDFEEFHDRRYASFSRLLRSTFDEACSHFDESTIDLLHIDGCHTFHAVQHDLETWSPKLSRDAVVLLHDTNVREGDFGVHKLWAETARGTRHFNFLHGHGLGVLGVGSHYSDPLNLLFKATEEAGLA